TIGDIIEALEEDLVKNPEPAVLQSIYRLKRNSIELRKSIWPLRQVINSLQREQSDLISDELQIYLRDIYDHIFRVSELLDNYRDIIFGMIDIYLSSISNKMNDIMKVLTIISTTFIPISFLAGFYGMNFIYMPELSNRAAYPILIIVMISIFTLMLLFFRRKKWI
ncbi:MAG: CorA family divalent cation transporter, partial [Promethearchaeota archaeon]